jgi:hypothetical protein
MPTPDLRTTNGHAPRRVAHNVADYVILAGECGSCFNNFGAAGAVTLTLPPAEDGLWFDFAVRTAQQLRVDPNGTDTISLPSNGVPGAAGKYLWADAVGETVRLSCMGGSNWAVYGYTGSWTAEA